MTSSNVWARLTIHLKESGLNAGHSMHSTRRGSMMHQHVEMHKSSQKLVGAAISNEQNAKCYTDPHRVPTRCPPGSE